MMQIPINMTILSFSQKTAGKINRWGFALLAAGVLAAGRPANAQIPTGFPSRIPGLPQRQWKPVIFGDDVPKRGNDKPKKDKPKKDGDTSSDS